jgi:hypothetical protein
MKRLSADFENGEADSDDEERGANPRRDDGGDHGMAPGPVAAESEGPDAARPAERVRTGAGRR